MIALFGARSTRRALIYDRRTHLKHSHRRAGRVRLEVCLLVLSFVTALLGSSNWPHPAWSLVAFANYIWLCALLFRIEPRGAVLVLPQIINNASSMVALIMIEFGGEMFELGLVGRPGPWSNQINICNLMFYVGVVAAIRPLLHALDHRGNSALSPVLDRFANLTAGAVLALVGLITVAMIVRGLQYGFPLLAGIDRFAFRRFSADKVTLYALNLKFVIGYALGFVAFVIPAAKWLRVGSRILFVGIMVLYFMFGDKFFTQLSALSAFLSPYLYNEHRRVGRQLWAYGVAGALALTCVMVVTTYIYSKGFTETSAATTKRLSGRIVGQGELWFLQSGIGGPALRWNGPLIDRYAESLSIKSVDLFALQNSLGPNYFSNGYAPDYLRASLHKNAGTVTYTAVTEAMGLVLFGWIGLGLMMFVLGTLLGLSGAYIAYGIENRAIFSIIFAAYIYTQLRSSIVQATPWVVASIYSIRWQALILVIELVMLALARSNGGLGNGYSRRGRLLTRRVKPTTDPAV